MAMQYSIMNATSSGAAFSLDKNDAPLTRMEAKYWNPYEASSNCYSRLSLNIMKFFAIIALGLAAVATAAPAPQLDCTRDGFFCEPCVNGKRQCVACADGTGLGLVQDC
ncbi:MFS domain-containing protein [Fusarium sp. LHS14.1]|nr:MFS domain-containing protein [Fusarium sp. LHS14.1]